MNAFEILHSLHHSTGFGSSKTSSTVTKSWFYYKNNQLMKLTHIHNELNIVALNPVTYIREDTHVVSDKFYENCCDSRIETYIRDINIWLNDNLQFIIDSNTVYKNSLDVIKYVSDELGEYNFANVYEVGWSAPQLLKLVISLYNGEILLTYKNKDIKLNEEKLKLFIQKNKETIFKAKERDNQKHMKKVQKMREEEKMKALEEATQRLNLSKSDHDATKRVGYNSSSVSISIPRTLKQRYETQACKPFPVKYPWNTKRMDS